VAVKIRLKRMGKIRAPYYRIVVADSRTRRDGRVIEEIGKYHPKADPSVIEVESERAQYWLSVGAQPTEAVAAILKVTGDWQRFKGEPGAEGTLKVAAEKKSKQDIFNEILKETHSELTGEATTSAKRSSKAAKAGDDTTRAAVEATGGDAASEDTPAAEATGASSEGTQEPETPQESAQEPAQASAESSESTDSTESTDSAESTETAEQA
jgi:small subunit ribosomal protein S16